MLQLRCQLLAPDLGLEVPSTYFILLCLRSSASKKLAFKLRTTDRSASRRSNLRGGTYPSGMLGPVLSGSGRGCRYVRQGKVLHKPRRTLVPGGWHSPAKVQRAPVLLGGRPGPSPRCFSLALRLSLGDLLEKCRALLLFFVCDCSCV